MNRVVLIQIALVALLMSPGADAKLNGKNVVYVHGLQFSALLDPRIRDNQDAREADVDHQSGPELDSIIDARLYYNSADRLIDNASYLEDQIEVMVKNGTCAEGCFFITASTGDLVGRYVIEKLNHWKISSSEFWVIASFDIVGAGGGTELANIGVALIEGNVIVNTIRRVFEAVFPIDFWAAGMGYNLQPTIARRTARQNRSVPRLRFVGRGENEFGFVLKKFLRGGSDSVVPLHSACGSTKKEIIFSCSNRRSMDGKNVAWTSGASNFMHNHFPVLMARDMHHTQIDYKGIAVPLNNNSTLGGVGVSFKEKVRTTGHWFWKRTYTTIDKPSNQTLVRYFINEFD